MADCPYVQVSGEGTAFCSLAANDIERVQREHRGEIERLRKIEEAAREFFAAHQAVEDGLASFDLHNAAVDRLGATNERLAALLGQKEQSTDE